MHSTASTQTSKKNTNYAKRNQNISEQKCGNTTGTWRITPCPSHFSSPEFDLSSSPLCLQCFQSGCDHVSSLPSSMTSACSMTCHHSLAKSSLIPPPHNLFQIGNASSLTRSCFCLPISDGCKPVSSYLLHQQHCPLFCLGLEISASLTHQPSSFSMCLAFHFA